MLKSFSNEKQLHRAHRDAVTALAANRAIELSSLDCCICVYTEKFANSNGGEWGIRTPDRAFAL
jgi:hypothetical protein